MYIDGFHGASLHFRGQELGSVFSAAVHKILASKHHVESLPLVLKGKRAASPKVKVCCTAASYLFTSITAPHYAVDLPFTLARTLDSSLLHR